MVYAVVYSYYSDWRIYGYFTDKHEAEKYCVAHKGKNLYVKELSCMEGKENLDKIKVKYEFRVRFENKDNSWDCVIDDNPYLYGDKYLRSNNIYSNNPKGWIVMSVNSEDDNIDRIKKIAQDIFYQFLDSCDGKPTQKSMDDFNKILSAAEDERKEKERLEAIKEKELKELERLKAKYEG